MALLLKPQIINFNTDQKYFVCIKTKSAQIHGIKAGDNIQLYNPVSGAISHGLVYLVEDAIAEGYFGISSLLQIDLNISEKCEQEIELTPIGKVHSIELIKRKIQKKDLNKQEIIEIIQDIKSTKLTKVETAFSLSTIYNPGFSKNELSFLAHAIADSGHILKFEGIVADKHSIGGIAGKGITPLVVSLVASYGIKIPNTSTKSITTPAGTAEILETITPISFSEEQVKAFVTQTGGCMVWGGGVDIAPVDDELINVEKYIQVESFDKIVVSILAKKAAMGITHLIIDIPCGENGKVKTTEDLVYIKKLFRDIADEFSMKIFVRERYPKGIDGNGVGPLLEMREVMYIFENDSKKSNALENEALHIAGKLLELSEMFPKEEGLKKAKQALESGIAYAKFKQIIEIQGGKKDTSSKDLIPGKFTLTLKSVVDGRVEFIYNKKIIELAQVLGCPKEATAGIYLYKAYGDNVLKGELLFSIYATSQERLDLGKKYVLENHLFLIK